jgi:UDP-glucose:(heptosyl)LPS alpha-1,3-glucosyltransferase
MTILTTKPSIVLFIKNYSQYGGVEKFCHHFFLYLIKKGYDVHVVCGKNKSGQHDKIIEIGMIRFGRFFKALTYYFSAKKYIKYLPLDTITISFGSVSDCHIVRSGGDHFSFICNTLNAQQNLYHKIRKGTQRLLAPINYLQTFIDKKIYTSSRTKKIVAISTNIAHELHTRYDLPPEKVVVICNGVDENTYIANPKIPLKEDACQHLAVPCDKKIIGFCSTNFELKGLRYLILTLSKLPDDYHVLVAGKRNSAKYERYAAQLGVHERVHFLGRIDNMPFFYACVDVLAHPSFYDTFGNVVAEALATGIPVITTRWTGAKDLIRESQNGFIVDPKNTDEFAKAVESAMSLDSQSIFGSVENSSRVFSKYVELIESIHNSEKK